MKTTPFLRAMVALLTFATVSLTQGAERKSAAAVVPTNSARPVRVDINTADAETLQTLPGVGPEIAEKIIASRPFSSTADLERVSGIGPEKMKLMRGQITASHPKNPKRAAQSDISATPRTEPQFDYRGRGEVREQRVDLNTASRAELEALPEIGPVKAQAIIDARPFNAPADVMKVKGIKESTYEAIKDKITVRHSSWNSR